MELNKKEMEVVTGGAFSYSMINAFSKAINIIYGNNEYNDLQCIIDKYEIQMEKFKFE